MKTRDIRQFLKQGSFEEQAVKLFENQNECIRDLQKAAHELLQMNEMLVKSMDDVATGASMMQQQVRKLVRNTNDDGLGLSTQSLDKPQ